ncbi:hypothetical protein FQN60_018550, partial [Etheostoma spectabile]
GFCPCQVPSSRAVVAFTFRVDSGPCSHTITQGTSLAERTLILVVGRETQLATFSCSTEPSSLSQTPAKAGVHVLQRAAVEGGGVALPGESLTGDTVRALIDRVNSSAGGAFDSLPRVLQQVSGITKASTQSQERLRVASTQPPRTPLRQRDGGKQIQSDLVVASSTPGPQAVLLWTPWLSVPPGGVSMRVTGRVRWSAPWS